MCGGVKLVGAVDDTNCREDWAEGFVFSIPSICYLLSVVAIFLIAPFNGDIVNFCASSHVAGREDGAAAVEEDKIRSGEGLGVVRRPAWQGVSYALICCFRGLAPFCSACSIVAAEDDPVKDSPCQTVSWASFGVLVKEAHHVVADHVAPVFDAFIFLEGSEDDVYVIFVEAVRDGYRFALRSYYCAVPEEQFIRCKVSFDCIATDVLPFYCLSQGEGGEVACHGEITIFEGGLGHAGVPVSVPVEPLYAVSLPGADSILLLASSGFLNLSVNNASITSEISSELGWKRRQCCSSGNSCESL